MSVVIINIIFVDFTSIVWSGILRITILSIYSVFDELLGIMLAALSIYHARCIRFLISTGTMKHASGNCFI